MVTLCCRRPRLGGLQFRGPVLDHRVGPSNRSLSAVSSWERAELGRPIASISISTAWPDPQADNTPQRQALARRARVGLRRLESRPEGSGLTRRGACKAWALALRRLD